MSDTVDADLNSLPNEIVAYMISFLTDPRDRLNLAATSKRMHALEKRVWQISDEAAKQKAEIIKAIKDGDRELLNLKQYLVLLKHQLVQAKSQRDKAIDQYFKENSKIKKKFDKANPTTQKEIRKNVKAKIDKVYTRTVKDLKKELLATKILMDNAFEYRESHKQLLRLVTHVVVFKKG